MTKRARPVKRDKSGYHYQDDILSERFKHDSRPSCWSCGNIIWGTIKTLFTMFGGKRREVDVHPGECEQEARRGS